MCMHQNHLVGAGHWPGARVCLRRVTFVMGQKSPKAHKGLRPLDPAGDFYVSLRSATAALTGGSIRRLVSQRRLLRCWVLDCARHRNRVATVRALSSHFQPLINFIKNSTPSASAATDTFSSTAWQEADWAPVIRTGAKRRAFSVRAWKWRQSVPPMMT